jgi:hypothetical protein
MRAGAVRDQTMGSCVVRHVKVTDSRQRHPPQQLFSVGFSMNFVLVKIF